MSEQKLPKPWYKRWWGVLLIILFFPLLVPYLIWAKTSWNKYVKIFITFICVSIIVSTLASGSINRKEALDLVNQAENYISEGKINEALEAISTSKLLNSDKSQNIAFSLEEKINKMNSDDFIKKTLTEMSDGDFELLKSGELKTVFIDHAKLNAIFLNKLIENADMRTKYIAEAEEQKRLAEITAEKNRKEIEEQGRLAKIEAEKKQKEEAEKQRKIMIERQFSSWDGSHRNLTAAIKESMDDPKSYEHVETLYWDKGDHLIVSTTFRGKNAFGGIVKNTVKVKMSLDGETIEVLEQY